MDTKKLSEYSLIFLGICLVVFLMLQFSAVLRPLAIACMLAFLFTPYLRMDKKNRHKIIWKIAIYAILLIGIVVIIVSTFISTIPASNERTIIQNKASDFTKTFSINIGGEEVYPLQTIDTNEITKTLSSLLGLVINSLSSFFSEIFTILLLLIFVIPAINGGLKNASLNMKKKEEGALLEALYDMESGIRQYLKVKTIISAITGGLSLIIMLIFGVKFAILFAVIIFLFNYVPAIGSIVGVGLVLIVELISSGFGLSFIIMGILLIVVQNIMGNYVEPKFTGKKLEMSGLTVLLSLFFWGALWGIGGMLFSVPFTLAVRILYRHLKKNKHI